jgi:hypothetical protein
LPDIAAPPACGDDQCLLRGGGYIQQQAASVVSVVSVRRPTLGESTRGSQLRELSGHLRKVLVIELVLGT